MRAADLRRAVAAATSTASGLGLTVDDAVVLNDSNRLVVRLTPCHAIARVTPLGHYSNPEHEVELARRLGARGSPVAALDPRLAPRAHVIDGFAVSFWAAVDLDPAQDVAPSDYAEALARLHRGMRGLDVEVPHFTERIAETQQWVASRELTPDLGDADRELLAESLAGLRRSVEDRDAVEQLLHGEPHPWNVLRTTDGPVFIDLENAVRGPVEFDLAWVPQAVCDRYPNADQELVAECRGIVVGLVAASRWRGDDEHPSGRPSGVEFLDHLRAGSPWHWL
jgi:hypothetical protein